MEEKVLLRGTKEEMIISFVFSLIFWLLFMFVSKIFFIFAISSNAVQILIIVIANSKKRSVLRHNGGQNGKVISL